jgi:hypothetical protein
LAQKGERKSFYSGYLKKKKMKNGTKKNSSFIRYNNRKKNEKTLFTMAATNNLLCVSFIRKMENLPGVFLKK